MNKTVVFVCFIILAAVGLTGAVVILIIKPEASATFTTLLVTVLGLAVSAAGTFYALGKQGEKLDTIARQTNGTTSAIVNENIRLTRLLAERGTAPTSDEVEVNVGPKHGL
ncbi:hypothetical protein [Herbiconiux flava]|uniref:Uncharacterized protein n=1 Tax=Herbiconiux flava TaxID=881268 RepID=A0A852STD6_9MICO|nr:hypothetical protein [Herbiconiux flava]NYD72288.1 hypothetical protein [Herbiconiux flava]GLK17749.1 hypothetical protein GCM10017602_22310 [Herbiconiux flava]